MTPFDRSYSRWLDKAASLTPEQARTRMNVIRDTYDSLSADQKLHTRAEAAALAKTFSLAVPEKIRNVLPTIWRDGRPAGVDPRRIRR